MSECDNCSDIKITEEGQEMSKILEFIWLSGELCRFSCFFELKPRVPQTGKHYKIRAFPPALLPYSYSKLDFAVYHTTTAIVNSATVEVVGDWQKHSALYMPLSWWFTTQCTYFVLFLYPVYPFLPTGLQPDCLHGLRTSLRYVLVHPLSFF